MIIAFDCVGPQASCAVKTDSFYEEYCFPDALSNTIACDLVLVLLELTKGQLRQAKVVATSTGPGSFTGIRLGLATALGLHQTTQCVLFTPTTLDLWCYAGWRAQRTSTWAAIDSQRGDFFVQGVDADFQITQAPHLLKVEDLEKKNFVSSLECASRTLIDFYEACQENNWERVRATPAHPFYVKTPQFVKQKHYQ